MSLLVPFGLLQLHVLPQTHFHEGHLTGPHAAYSPENHHLQFTSPAYTTSGPAGYPPSVYSSAYHHSGPAFQHDYRHTITYNPATFNEIVRPVVYTRPAPAADEGRYTQPRVFFDDDHSEVSRVRRLEEDLREERLRQNIHHHPNGAVPVRETRRYEKSVQGDLDFSEDKKLKLAKRRKRDTSSQSSADSSTGTVSGTELSQVGQNADTTETEGRRFYPGQSQPHYASSGGFSFQQQRPFRQPSGGRPHQLQQQRPQQQRSNRQDQQRPSRGGGQRGKWQQKQPLTSGPNTILRGQSGFYGAFRGSLGGQSRKQRPSG